MFNSLRWRLSLTYGGISLLASICLGAILLVSLQGFYRQQETEYLLQNGRTIGRALFAHLGEDADQTVLESQINTFAFLTQTRIQLLDADHEVLFDSGSPDQQNGILTLGLQVETEDGVQEFTQDLNSSQVGYEAKILIENGTQSVRSEAVVTGNASFEEELFTPLQLIGDPTGDGGRSKEDVLISLTLGVGKGENGMLRLSEGPAYGRSIIGDVAIGLVVAGTVATLLTSLFGWWLSGRLVSPLNELESVTQQMGDGDLAVRSTIQRPDEIGRVATTFNLMADQIDETVQSLRRFVADAAHEISTPITALRTHLELLEQESGPNERLDQALAQTNRIQTLSADLLQLSELDGHVQPEMEPVDFAALITAQNEQIAAQADQKDIEFKPAIPESGLQVQGNASHLLSLYQNLVENALKFTPAGGEIKVSLETNQDQVVLKIVDSGIGLGADADKIFERFYRSPQVSGYPGNGLGLAICAKIVDQHHGEISAMPQDAGASLSVSLPLLNPNFNSD